MGVNDGSFTLYRFSGETEQIAASPYLPTGEISIRLGDVLNFWLKPEQAERLREQITAALPPPIAVHHGPPPVDPPGVVTPVPGCWHEHINPGGYCAACGVRAAISLNPEPPRQHPDAHLGAVERPAVAGPECLAARWPQAQPIVPAHAEPDLETDMDSRTGTADDRLSPEFVEAARKHLEGEDIPF